MLVYLLGKVTHYVEVLCLQTRYMAKHGGILECMFTLYTGGVVCFLSNTPVRAPIEYPFAAAGYITSTTPMSAQRYNIRTEDISGK